MPLLFCPIDPSAAEAAAEKMSRVNQACSDASFLRTMAVSLFAFLGIMFIPFMGLLGFCGYYFLVFAVPFMTIRWWIRFHAIQGDDSDFKRAKTTVIVISALCALPLLHFIVSRFEVGLLQRGNCTKDSAQCPRFSAYALQEFR